MHGGRLLVILRALIYTSILLGLTAPTFASTLKDNTESTNFKIDSLLKNNRLNLSRNDKKIANNISHLFDVSKRGYPNQQIVKNIIKKLKNNDEFSIFKTWALNILKISKLSKLNEAPKAPLAAVPVNALAKIKLNIDGISAKLLSTTTKAPPT